MRQYLSVLFLLAAMVALTAATVTAEDWKEYITAEGEIESTIVIIIITPRVQFCMEIQPICICGFQIPPPVDSAIVG